MKPVGMNYWNHNQKQSDFPVDTARMRNVIDLVAQKSGWANRKTTKGHGWGFAAHRSFLTYVAVVTEVQVDDRGRVTIPNMHIAVDAGQTYNRDRVISQFEGAATFGTSIAMMSEISVKDGKVQQGNDPAGRKPAVDRGNTLYTFPASERQEFIKLSAAIENEWAADMDKRNFDGKKLLATAKELIAKHGRS